MSDQKDEEVVKGEGLTEDQIEEFLGQNFDARGKDECVTIESTEVKQFEYNGDVVFEKDISLEGNALKIKGNATFKGQVRRADIIALGKITFEDRVLGCNVYSLDNIHIRSSLESDFMSFRDITVDLDLERSELTAGGSITGEKCAARGGELNAHEHIKIYKGFSFGSSLRLVLRAGDRKILLRKMQLLKHNIAEQEGYTNKVKQAIETLVRALVQKNLIGQKVPKLDELKQQHAILAKQLSIKKMALEQMKEAVQKMHGTVTVTGDVTEKTHISVDGAFTELSKPMSNIRFFSDGEVVRSESADT